MMRGIWLLLAVCAMCAHGQSAWTWTQADPGRQPRVLDVYHRNGHYYVSVGSREGVLGQLPTRSKLVVLNGVGEQLDDSGPILPGSESASISFVGARSSSTPLYVSGSCTMNGERGFFARIISGDWELSEPTIITYTGYEGSTSEKALPMADGGLIISGSLLEPPDLFPNRVVLVRIGPDGGVLGEAIYGTGNGQRICRYITEWNGEVWFTVDGGLQEFNDAGLMQAFRINESLEVEQTFLLPRVDRAPPFSDSLMVGVLDMTPISATRFAISGRFGSTWNPPAARAVVCIGDTTGATIRTWLPRSSYDQDFTPFLQGLTTAMDGNLWFAMHENAQLGPPSTYSVFEPNRIHVYKVDTSLNILCEHVLDGFADNAYYYITRIKATDDGGFILMGSRRDMSDPSGYFEAWAQKFAATDCSVGLSEAVAEPAVLYPNPGREGFHLLLNGAAIAGALELLDATGRKVGQVPVQAGQAYFDARSLPAGLYLYRVLDRSGSAKATGRWVKE